MYIVDVNKPAGRIDAPPPPPPQPDYPSPPPNAIPFSSNGSQIPIYYNQTVVLQCLTSGVVSPVLIIRKVDHQTTVVGGGLQEGAKGVVDHYCSPGEVCGDPVSQLHKIAFEVYDGTKGMPEPGTPGLTGAFLSCMGEKVNTYRPIDGRTWNNNNNNNNQGTGSNSPALPGSPIASNGSGNDYFGHNVAASEPASPSGSEFLSNDGGRVKKKRSTSQKVLARADADRAPLALSRLANVVPLATVMRHPVRSGKWTLVRPVYGPLLAQVRSIGCV
jgi:recombining binding protein (suppressor of hairless)